MNSAALTPNVSGEYICTMDGASVDHCVEIGISLTAKKVLLLGNYNVDWTNYNKKVVFSR